MADEIISFAGGSLYLGEAWFFAETIHKLTAVYLHKV